MNPGAGAAQEVSAAGVRDALQQRGLEANVVEASGAEVTQAARRAVASGAELLIAAGGDGTVSSVAQALAGTGAALAVLPIGTLNHFAKDLRVPLDWKSALAVAAGGNFERVDMAEVNGRLFLNNSSIGVYPRIVMEREEQQRMGRSKWLAFCRAVVAVSVHAPRLYVRVKSPGEQIVEHTPFLFIGNNAYELQGIHIGTRKSLSAGELYVVSARAAGAWGLAQAAWHAFRGGEEGANCCLDVLKTDRLRVETTRRRLPVAVDGEVIELSTPLEYRIHRGALTVAAPVREEKAA